jgi:hypothetical protein
MTRDPHVDRTKCARLQQIWSGVTSVGKHCRKFCVIERVFRSWSPSGAGWDTLSEVLLDRKRTDEGFRNRYGAKQNEELFERAQKQVRRELALIEKLKLAGYFLIVWDIIRHCREQNILVQGRGSAAADPVGMELAML